MSSFPMDQESNRMPSAPITARAEIVNRTHRVVRAQALAMQQQRQQQRGLWAPLTISSTLLLVVCYTAWAWLDINSLTHNVDPEGAPGASEQLLVLLLWSLPVTAALIGFAWLRRVRNRHHGELPQ